MSSPVYTSKELSKDKLKYEYEISVCPRHFEDGIQNKLKEISKMVKKPGFRVGKVPIYMVERDYKDSATREVVQSIVEETSKSFIQDNKFNELVSSNVDIISMPDTAKGDGSGGFIYKLAFEIMPEAPLLDLEGIKVKNRKVEIKDSDVEEFCNELMLSKVSFVKAPDGHKVTAGDKVNIDFEGKIKGKVFKGGSAKGMFAELSKGYFLPDFESQLIGMEVGERKTFPLKFPEDYAAKHLAGQNAEMSLVVNDILLPKTASNYEELAKFNGFDDFTKFSEVLAKQLGEQYNKMSGDLMKKELFDCIDKKYTFDIPESIVKQEQRRFEEERKNNSGESVSDADLLKEAEKSVKFGMLLIRFARESGISIAQEDLVNLINRQYISKGVTWDRITQLLKTNREFVDFVRGKALEEKVINYLVDKVEQEKETVSLKDLKVIFENV